MYQNKKQKEKKQYRNRQLTPLPLKKQKKKTTKQNGICILKFAHKSDLTIYSLEIMRIYTQLSF